LEKWNIKGEFLANCNCTVFCPCALSLGHHPPTEGYCQTWFAIHIDSGQWGNVSLDGINVGMLADIPNSMRHGGWSVGLYIDESADQVAADGLEQIFSGNAGGSTGLFKLLTAEFLGTQRVPVEYAKDGDARRIAFGDKITAEIRPVEGAAPGANVVISNTSYWVAPEIIVSQAVKAKVRDWGRVWDLSGKSAEICAIDWRGP
jgi:hypothetical protein